MWRYLARRTLVALALAIAVSSGALVLARLTPGDYVTQSFGVKSGSAAAAAARARYGLERPFASQYWSWLTGAIRFDFGRSMMYDRPVTDLIPERAANSAVLAVAALVLGTLVGVPLGVFTGSRTHGFWVRLTRLTSLVCQSAPPLLLSLTLVAIAASTGWLPAGGMYTPTAGTREIGDLLRHMIVPVLALALPIAAGFEQLQSRASREVTGERFVLAALAKGAGWSRVTWRNALRPALVPVVAVYGITIGSLLSGSFVVEMITNWPGLGRLMLDALRARDTYLVAGCAAAGSIFLALGTLLSDLLLAVVDPRTRE